MLFFGSGKKRHESTGLRDLRGDGRDMIAAHPKKGPASGERLAKPVMEISTPVGPLHPKVLALWPSKARSHEWTPGRIDGDTSALYLSFGSSGPLCVGGVNIHLTDMQNASPITSSSMR